jgi:PST family polysaccharide transporter
VAAALPLSLLAPWLIRLLFGPDYEAAIDVLRIHAWSLPLVGLSVARARTLIAENLPRFNLLAACVNLVANALLAWWLIPPLGAVGAAWASVLPRLLSGVAINFAFARTRPQGVIMLRALRAPLLLPGYVRAWRAT